jgi:aryl-alcohol dehydrogenase-like predicted oxidoreductase
LYAGVSEWSAAQIEEAVATADKFLLDRIVVNQPIYNMFNRYIENEVIPVSDKYGIGQVVFSPLAQGVLTGKYKGGQVPDNSRASNQSINNFIKGMLNEDVFKKVEQLEAVAKEMEVTLPELALAWILRQPNVSSALIGASKPSQVEQNVKAIEVILPSEIQDRIEMILS